MPPAITGEVTGSTPSVLFFETLSEATDRETDDGAVAAFHVEIVDTPVERSRGLMHRRTMADGWGMLFIYPDEAPRGFWMKNTLMPLDMVFMSAEGKVLNIVRRAEPQTRIRRESDGPARFVLELPGGQARSSGIEPGQYIRVTHVPSRHRPDR